MFRISPLFSDGAVLCRGKELRVFGEAPDGVRVHCELRDGKDGLLAKGDARAWEGKFLILLPPQEAATGCRLCLSAEGETITVLDICVGEVFLAGGQSNMEMELRNADEGQELIAQHVNPMVRYFNVPRYACFSEKREAAWRSARWQAIGPGRGGDMSAVAYFFATRLQRQLGVPVGIIDCYWGGTSITCWMDAAWLGRTAEGRRYLEAYGERAAGVTMDAFLEKEKAFQEALGVWNAQVAAYRADHPGCAWDEVEEAVGPCPWNPPAGPADPYRPAGLYDTMVAPLTPAALTGILYYQGETDATGTDSLYDTLMMSLIDRWRGAFGAEDLPFLFAQLPMWIAKGAADSKTWPALRLAQRQTRDRMRHTGMICLLDQGEFNNLHPTNKRVVGERFFELAKREIYGLGGKTSPRVTGRIIQDGMMTLLTDQPLMTGDGKEPALLELAGADGVFRPARAMLEGPMLHLTAAGVPQPVHCRYAWTDYGTVNLFSGEGLPLEPFWF